MGRTLAFLISFVLLSIGATSALQGAETVWSGLVIAENVAQPQTIPPELTRIEGSLKKFFGYNQFQVIGQSQKTLKTGQEDWLATSKFFGLHVDAQGEAAAGYVLNLKLYKQKELLLETDAKLSKRSPLVIKGPQVGSGQLLLVLVAIDGRARPSGRADADLHALFNTRNACPVFFSARAVFPYLSCRHVCGEAIHFRGHSGKIAEKRRSD